MRFKSGFLVGLSAGYVLGTKAGQERYQQIVDATSKLRENPGVQRLTGEVNKTVNVSKDRVAETAAAKADQAKEAVASKVGGNAGSTTGTSGSSGLYAFRPDHGRPTGRPFAVPGRSALPTQLPGTAKGACRCGLLDGAHRTEGR